MSLFEPTLLLMNLGWPELLVLLTVGLLFVPFIYALVHCIRNRRLSDTHKVLWILALFIFPFFGSVTYLIIRPVSRGMLK